ncbi:MAG TPA: helicase HerA-like domain-containing protein [Acidimicrobiales bacterium]
MVDLGKGQWYVGERVDPAGHGRTGEAVVLDRADLTTHGLLVGMTGSGKTGLGVVLVEEALLSGVPVLVVDPKGDLAGLALTFPGLSADEFRPWVGGGDADQVATSWRDGLASWGIGPDRVAALRAAADVTVYTPGSTAGVPLNVVGSLAAPASTDPEVVGDEIEGFVAGLLGLVGVDADPLASPEHVLLSTLVQHAWSAGQDLDLPTLVGQVLRPPIRRLGVFDLDEFFPPDDRSALARRLNGLLASPSFGPWAAGAPLDVDGLLFGPGGRPRCAVVSVAHLSDEERQFAVSLLLGKLVTWMRRQAGTTDLRVLVYFDEVAGYVPPVAAPPAKGPILTLLKQARAFGVGVVLATQNPVDVDYRGIGNAGTWMIGRLQTERDRDRLLDGLGAASGGVDLAALAGTIGGLAKREFVLRRPGSSEPVVMGSRWAMSYLAGPLTREQIATLTHGSAGGAAVAPAPAPAPAPAEPSASDGEPPPPVAQGLPVRWLDPAAPWAAAIGAAPAATRFAAGLAARVALLYDDERAGVRHTEEWEAVLFPLGAEVDVAAAVAVDWDDRDLRPDPPAGASYVVPEAPVGRAATITAVRRDLVEHLRRHRTVEVLRCPGLKLWSRVGETGEAFEARCRAAAADAADREAATLRRRYEARLDRARDAAAAARDRVDEAEVASRSRRNEEVLSTVGSVLGDFLGGRHRVGTLARRAGSVASRRGRAASAGRRAASARNRAEEREEDVAELEAELAEELAVIDEKWQAAAGQVEPVQVPLEKSDVAVDDLVLVWVPVP